MRRNLEGYLRSWIKDPIRTPLIVRGARQVGKSHTIREFGLSAFSKFVEVNLETAPQFLSCFKARNPQEICSQIEAITNQSIVSGQTLLFIDEIQYSPDALLALRSFKEKMPELHVIAAGSLLEFALQDENAPSFPVGRITFCYLHPMTFLEFLNALNEEKLIQLIRQSSLAEPPAEAVHQRLLELVRTFLVLGGMPEVLASWRQTASIVDAKRVQNRLLTAFAADFAKYGKRYDPRKLQQLLLAVPRLVGKKFKYSHVDSHVKARDFKPPLLDLERAALIRLVRATAANGIPLGAEVRENAFKVQFIDIGLMLNLLGADLFTSSSVGEALFVNEGALAEQFVGQELMANAHPEVQPQLYYWSREAVGSEAEVDFIMAWKERAVAIEVKAGATGRLKSLRRFMTEKNSPIGIRVSQHKLSMHEGILSVPMYMVSEIPRLLAGS